MKFGVFSDNGDGRGSVDDSFLFIFEFFYEEWYMRWYIFWRVSSACFEWVCCRGIEGLGVKGECVL